MAIAIRGIRLTYATLMYLQVNRLEGTFQENSRMLLDSIGKDIKDGTIRAGTDP